MIKQKNMFQNNFNPSCIKMASFIKLLVLTLLLIIELLRGRINTFETTKALLFQMHVPKHFWADAVSIACFFINWMPSSVLNLDTPYHILFPNKPLFPIEPRIFGQDGRPQVSKLDHKSLKCIFLGYSRVK